MVGSWVGQVPDSVQQPVDAEPEHSARISASAARVRSCWRQHRALTTPAGRAGAFRESPHAWFQRWSVLYRKSGREFLETANDCNGDNHPHAERKLAA